VRTFLNTVYVNFRFKCNLQARDKCTT